MRRIPATAPRRTPRPLQRFPLALALLLLAALTLAACGGGRAWETEPPASQPQQQGSNNQPQDPQPQAQPETGLPQVASEEEPPGDEAQGDAQAAGVEPEAEPIVFQARLVPETVNAGYAFIVAVAAPQAAAASVAYEGQFYSLQPDGEGFSTVLAVPLGRAPGTDTLSVAVFPANGGSPVFHELLLSIGAAEFPEDTLTLEPGLERLLDSEVAAEDQAVRDAVQLGKSPERLWSGTFLPPVAAPAITSVFGEQRTFTDIDATSVHTGLDFGGAEGDPIAAANDGIVAWVGETERRGLGVIIDHGGGVFSAYWHLSAQQVEDGQTVRQGQQIALMGRTGLSTGPHLHFEVVINGIAVDPLPWIRDLEAPNPSAAVDALAGDLRADQDPPRTPQPDPETPIQAAAEEPVPAE